MATLWARWRSHDHSAHARWLERPSRLLLLPPAHHPCRRRPRTGPHRPATYRRPRSEDVPVPYRCAPQLAAASRLCNYKPYAGLASLAEVPYFNGDTVELRLESAPSAGPGVGGVCTPLREASVLLFWQFDEVRCMPGSLFEREQHALQHDLVEAHRDELLLGARTQSDPVARDLDAESAERPAG